MKSLMNLIMFASIMALVVACGKDNRSGRSGTFNYPYPGPNGNPLMSHMGTAPNVVNMALQEFQCNVGQPGIQRHHVRIPMPGFSAISAPYLGVTSNGDVAFIDYASGAPVFNAFICPRSFGTGQGQLMGIDVGKYSPCVYPVNSGIRVPIMTAARMLLPGNIELNFRSPQYGMTNVNQRFSFCLHMN